MKPAAIVWLFSFICFALGCSQQFVIGVPTQVAADCGVTISDIGLLMAAFGVTNAIGTPVLLALLGHHDQRFLLMLGLSLMLLGLLVMAVTSVFPILLVARLLMGVGHDLICATAYAAAVELAPPAHKASAMANVALGFSAAQVLAMPIARLATTVVSWHALYGVLALVGAVCAAVIWREVPAGHSVGEGAGLDALAKPLHNPVVVLLLAGVFCSQIGYLGVYTYITPYLEELLGSEGQLVSGVLLLVGLMSVVGAKVSGFSADRIGLGKTLVGGMAFQLVAYLELLLAYGSPVLVVGGMCLWIAAAWTLMPAQNVLLTKSAPESPSLVISLSNSSLHAGGAVGSVVGGAFIGVAPLSSLPILGVCGICLGIACASVAVTRARAWGRRG